MIFKILNSYPRTRPPLPKKYKDIYSQHYIYCRSNKGLIRKIFIFFTNWMHLAISKESNENKSILELGAGTLNHLNFEKYSYYDIIEPFDDLYLSATNRNQIRYRYKYSNDEKCSDTYDRIISVATLEHLTNLPLDMAILALKLKKKGIFQHSYPSEGSLFWHISSRYISGLNFYLKYKLNFKVFLNHEHVNSANDIETVIKKIFKKVLIKRFPLNFFNLSLFSHIKAEDPDIELCKKIINSYKGYKYETIF